MNILKTCNLNLLGFWCFSTIYILFNTKNHIGKMMGRFLVLPYFLLGPDKMETSLIGSLFFLGCAAICAAV